MKYHVSKNGRGINITSHLTQFPQYVTIKVELNISILMEQINILKPDAKGRITLGVLAKGVSSFHVTHDKEGRIILEPYTEIPLREKWLYNNKIALKQVFQGIKDAAHDKLISKGDFSKYLDDDEN